MEHHDKRFPGESEAYRRARNELLSEEIALRSRLAEIAAQRQALPPGGPVPENYVFEEMRAGTVHEVRLSDLFEPGKDGLILYSYMYRPDADQPCPMCTAFLDSTNANAPHLTQRVNLAVIAKSSIERLATWSANRGWHHLRLLSSAKNSYNADYFAENETGQQLPALNIFVNRDGEIRHHYATELLYADLEGQPRHVDPMWPLWNFLDLVPEGRGRDWYPRLAY